MTRRRLGAAIVPLARQCVGCGVLILSGDRCNACEHAQEVAR